jgi:hypothetical protein
MDLEKGITSITEMRMQSNLIVEKYLKNVDTIKEKKPLFKSGKHCKNFII